MHRTSITESEIRNEKRNNAIMLLRRKVIEKMTIDIDAHASENPDYFTLDEYELFKMNVMRENVFGGIGNQAQADVIY